MSEVRQIAVRYVRPEAEEQERLRATVAEMQAMAILRAAEARKAGSSGTRGKYACSAVGSDLRRSKSPSGVEERALLRSPGKRKPRPVWPRL